MTKLQLNELTLNYKGFPEEGTDRNIDQMPKLIAEGRIPISASDLMKRRLEVLTASDEVKTAWFDNYFDTGDSIVYHPNGNIKIVLDAKQLRELNPQSRLIDGALTLKEDGIYGKLEGQEFSRSELEKYAFGRALKQKEVVNHPIWQALARDPNLLKEYADAIFSQAKKEYDYNENMGVYLGSPKDVPTMRLWCVGRLYGRSYAYGYFHLDLSGGRLVGVAPEAPIAQKTQEKQIVAPNLEQVLAVTNKYSAEINRKALREELGKLYQ